MTGYVSLFVQAAFIENLALSFFLGMCMFLAGSKRLETDFGLGLAVFVVQTITVPVNHLIHSYLLKEGALAWAGLGDMDLGSEILCKEIKLPEGCTLNCSEDAIVVHMPEEEERADLEADEGEEA